VEFLDYNGLLSALNFRDKKFVLLKFEWKTLFDILSRDALNLIIRKFIYRSIASKLSIFIRKKDLGRNHLIVCAMKSAPLLET